MWMRTKHQEKLKIYTMHSINILYILWYCLQEVYNIHFAKTNYLPFAKILYFIKCEPNKSVPSTLCAMKILLRQKDFQLIVPLLVKPVSTQTRNTRHRVHNLGN